MRTRQIVLAGIVTLAAAGCSPAPQEPVPVDTRNDSCAQCRMAVSDPRFAAQLVAPGEEPRLFDDIGCLQAFVERGSVPKDATAYVADHRTKEWVIAARALYVRNLAVQTPMASHLLAFGSLGSRDADPDGGGNRLAPTDVFGAAGPPMGSR
jgi:copper chaperone NosL